MLIWITSASELLLLAPTAFAASWLTRRAIRSLTRRAVRRAQRVGGGWRVRLDRIGDEGPSDARRRQRADAAARMIGHLVTVVIFVVAILIALELLGVDAVWAISSAGFIGFALALSGQDVIKDFFAGTRSLLEDRYAAGDEVVLQVAGHEVRGTVDLVGTASIRLRTREGATWHAGHHSIESVTNLSQLPAVSRIPIGSDDWTAADVDGAPDRLVAASDDVELTGVVFLRDIETHGTDDPGTVTVEVKSNRPLSLAERDAVRARLLAPLTDRLESEAGASPRDQRRRPS